MVASKFNHLSQAISYINRKNPARARSVNLLENGTSSGRRVDPDFIGISEADIFASLLLGLKKTLKLYPDLQQSAWKLKNLGDRKEQSHPRDIAEKLGFSPSTIYRWISQIDEDLEREFIKRDLLESD